jgi:membrane fusion protein, multidrug efflux system
MFMVAPAENTSDAVRTVFKILLPIALLAGSLLAAGYLRATKPEVEPAAASERVWTVSVEPLELGTQQPILKLYGDIVAARDVTLRPFVGGEIVEASPSLVAGGRLAADELVIAIDPFEYRTARDERAAEVREARARKDELQSMLKAEWSMLRLDETQLELAERDRTRYEKLRGSQAASEKALDDSEMKLAERQAAISMRQQTIATLEARLDQQDAAINRLEVAVERAERDLADIELRAPFAGFVTEVEAALGKWVNAGDPIARLIDEDRLEIRFTLTDADFGRLWQDGLIGRQLTANWRLGQTTFGLEGKVTRVDSAIDPASGGVEVFAEITGNPGAAPLRPGAFVEVLLPDLVYRQVAELPASALFGGDTVYAVEDGRLVERTVALVADRGLRILVQGDLAAGEPILTSRLAEVAPGLKVEIAP